MSEHSDDDFDRWLQAEDLRHILIEACENNGAGCDWTREINEDGMLECRTCGKVVDE